MISKHEPGDGAVPSQEAGRKSVGGLFPPLDVETRVAVPTDCAAHHLSRRPQTLRTWACFENGPLRPIRINGRLAWPVADIRRVLGGGA